MTREGGRKSRVKRQCKRSGREGEQDEHRIVKRERESVRERQSTVEPNLTVII